MGRPVHLDEVAPRRDPQVAALAVAPRAAHRCVEAEQPAHGGVQPVRGEQVAGRPAVDEQVRAAVDHRAHGLRAHLDTRLDEAARQPRVQRRTPHAAARPGPEARVDAALPVAVADAGQVDALDLDAEVGQARERPRHQPLAAGLVDDPGPGLDDHDVEPGAARVQRGGQPHRPTAGDHQVMHVALRDRAARARAVRRVPAAAWPARRPRPAAARSAAPRWRR